jgi:hypothetical protein
MKITLQASSLNIVSLQISMEGPSIFAEEGPEWDRALLDVKLKLSPQKAELP